jgi:hypothetical protein
MTPKPEFMDVKVPFIGRSVPPNVHEHSGFSASSPVRTRDLLPQLDRVLYPSVRLWDQDQCQGNRKGRRRGGEDDHEEKPRGSVLSSYMEDENGEDVPEATRKAIRKMARGLFELLLMHKKAPATWGSVPLDTQTELIFRLETQYPFLQLCANHWKADMVATNSYSQWYSRAVGRDATNDARKTTQIAIKVESDIKVIDIDADDTGDENRSSNTGGKGVLTQWVHCEFIVGFETIRPVVTHQVLVRNMVFFKLFITPSFDELFLPFPMFECFTLLSFIPTIQTRQNHAVLL